MTTSWWLLALALAAGPVVQTEPPVDAHAQALADVQAVLDEVDRFQDVDLTWSNGVARLSGTVPSTMAREQVQDLASQLPGTMFVDNLLDVALEPEASAGLQDEATEEVLRGLFAQIDALRPVEVSVANGVVQLSGTVLDSNAKDKAVGLAERQDGVLYVDDRIEATTSLQERVGPAVDDAWSHLAGLLAMLPLLVVAGLVVVVSWLLARALTSWGWLLRRFDERPLLRNTIHRGIRIVVIGLGLLAALEILDATALVGAVVGTAGVIGVALGFAFQDIIENYLAGILLSLQQPFGKDDLIEVDGVLGVVVRLTARNTLLLTVDGNHVYLPNATVFKNKLTNYVRNPFRRFDFQVGVGVDEDLVAVLQLGMDTLRAMPGVVDEPAPAVRIASLGDSSVVVEVMGWVDQRDHAFLAVRTEAIRRIKEAYDDAGFDMPEPIYRVQLRQMAPAEAKPKARRAEPEGQTAVSLAPDRDLSRQAEEQREKEPAGRDLLTAS